MVRHSNNSSAVAEELFECEDFIVLVLNGLIKESVPPEVFFRVWDFNYSFTS